MGCGYPNSWGKHNSDDPAMEYSPSEPQYQAIYFRRYFQPTANERPCSFTTTVDNQETITIELYKGYDSVARGNKQLGRFDVHGLTPALAGIPEIVIGVEVDAGVDQLKVDVLERSRLVFQYHLPNNFTK